MKDERELWEQRKRAREMQEEKKLDVMGDAQVHALKKPVSRTSHESSENGGGSMVRRRLEEAAAKRKKRRRLITMIVAECIALVFIFGYAYVARQLNKIQRPDDFRISELETNELNVETVETMKGYWTIAIFGVDARDNAINKGTNADVNMICNINRDTGEIKLVSVFRDTYLNISEDGSYNKLNQAYFVGGPEQAIGALNRNLDLQINDYMTFNWKAVADAINVLGGVDIELSDAEFYYINGFITETVKATGIGSKHLTHAGMNHLDGVQAVAYGRLRLMDTDFARTERQRKVIAKAFEKVKSADFKTLNTLIGTVFPQVSTSIWVDDLVSNAKNVSKFHLGETAGFPQARGDVSMGKKGAVVVPQTLETNVVKLHEFLFNDSEYTPSKTVKNISAKIAADTGMYKEGQYIDHVNTEGVIQKPKATAAATTAAEEETTKAETESSESESETISKTTEAETDEFGNPLESETNPTTSETPGMGMRPTETDEFGNLLDPTERPGTGFHPTRPTESASESESVTRPGSTTEPTTGITTRPGTSTEPTTGTTTRPGNATEPTTGTTTRPGNATEPTTGTTTRPGSTTEPTTGTTTRPGTTTQPTTGAVTRPGSATEPTTGVTTRPGTTTETTAASNVTTKPGSSSTPGTTTDKVPGSSSGNGTVSAPGGSSTSGSSTSTVPGSSSSGNHVTAPTAPVPPTTSVSGTVAAPGQ